MKPFVTAERDAESLGVSKALRDREVLYAFTGVVMFKCFMRAFKFKVIEEYCEFMALL